MRNSSSNSNLRHDGIPRKSFDTDHSMTPLGEKQHRLHEAAPIAMGFRAWGRNADHNISRVSIGSTNNFLQEPTAANIGTGVKRPSVLQLNLQHLPPSGGSALGTPQYSGAPHKPNNSSMLNFFEARRGGDAPLVKSSFLNLQSSMVSLT